MRDFCITKASIATQSDTVDLEKPGIGIYVGGSGDVKVTTYDGDDITMVGLVAGVWHPIQAKRVWVTGTTASSILLGW